MLFIIFTELVAWTLYMWWALTLRFKWHLIHLKQAAPYDKGRSAKIMPIDADFLAAKLHERYSI